MAANKITTIDQYIAAQPAGMQPTLKKLRGAIKKAAPKAEEKISYEIPAFFFHGMLVYFAGFKNHYSVYPYPKTMQTYQEELKPYRSGKGTVKFPNDMPVPVKLVTAIVKQRIKENLEREALKAAKRKTISKKSK